MRSAQHRNVGPGVTQPIAGGRAEPTLWSRLLDGARPWGFVDATIGRHGAGRYRLIIYPPGIGTTDRRLARLWRGWPISGTTLMLLTVMLLGNAAAPPDTVLTVAAAVYLGVGALLFAWGGPARVHVRSMSIALMPGTADVLERRKYAEWHTLAYKLSRADDMLATGAISLFEHQATWREAYDSLKEIKHV